MMATITFQRQRDSISGDYDSLLSADSVPMQLTTLGESEWYDAIVGGRHLPFVQGCEFTRAT